MGGAQSGRLPGGWTLCDGPYLSDGVRGTRFARLDDGHPIPLEVAIGIDMQTGVLQAVVVPSFTGFGRTLLSFEAKLDPDDLALDRLTAAPFSSASVASGPDFVGARTPAGAARLSRQVTARVATMDPVGISVAAGFTAARIVAVASERWIARVEGAGHARRVYPPELRERALTAADTAIEGLRSLGGAGASVGFCVVTADGSCMRMNEDSDGVAAGVAETLRDAVSRLELADCGDGARIAAVLVTSRGATVLDRGTAYPMPALEGGVAPQPRR